jgi:hypothetical protein
MDHSPTDPHPLDYNATISRMEPGIAPVASEIALASIAISLTKISSELVVITQRMDDLRYAINLVSNGGPAVAGAISHATSNLIGALNDIKKTIRPPETME